MARSIAGLVRTSLRASASARQRARPPNIQTATCCLTHTMPAPDRLEELLNEGAWLPRTTLIRSRSARAHAGTGRRERSIHPVAGMFADPRLTGV
jgi:hypothetical protein